MLGKLLKYELKAMGRVMLPLYGVMAFAAVLFAFNQKIKMSGTTKFLINQFAIITGVLFGAAVLIAVVVMALIVIQRFYKNLLQTEGYLMFTLPAATHEHILSKALSSFIWILAGILVGGISGCLMISIVTDFGEFMDEVYRAWEFISPDRQVGPLIWFAVMLVMGLFESLIKVYAAMAVGHQLRTHRALGSVGAYIGFGVIESLAAWGMSKLGILQRGINLVVTDSGVMEGGVPAMQRAIGASAALLVLYGLLCWYLLDRRLNLE